MSARAPIAAVAIVVPARNEEDRLERCLRAITRAVAALPHGVAAQPLVVLDGCTDGSAAVAAQWPVTTLTTASAGVGPARARGVCAALELLRGMPLSRVWIANTDADSEVPEHWLSRQLALADAGWDAVLGTVAPDPLDLPVDLRDSAITTPAMTGEPVYGANLGVRASCYRAAGGFPAVREHEDVQLVAALRAAGARVTASYDIAVLTSGRLRGRAPGGYAGYLRQQLAATTAGYARGGAGRCVGPVLASSRSFCSV